MIMKKILISAILILVGCAGIQSIKVGGSYGEGKDKVGGEITLVVNEQKSEVEQAPILSGSDGKDYAAIDLGDLSKIEDLVKGLLGDVGISSRWTVKTLLENIKIAREKQAAKESETATTDKK
jgi:hypothetical protein